MHSLRLDPPMLITASLRLWRGNPKYRFAATKIPLTCQLVILILPLNSAHIHRAALLLIVLVLPNHLAVLLFQCSSNDYGCMGLCFTVKPRITYIVNQSTSEMEEQVTLTCEASGDPTPTINWSYGEHVFTEGEQVKYYQQYGCHTQLFCALKSGPWGLVHCLHLSSWSQRTAPGVK